MDLTVNDNTQNKILYYGNILMSITNSAKNHLVVDIIRLGGKTQVFE